MKAYRFQPREVVQTFSLIEELKAASCHGFIEAAKAAFPLFRETLRRPVSPRFDHSIII